jgi:prepilin-type N-terminal cleavage/methylation domain-containing protein
MKNRTSRQSGFTLVEIMIVVAIIGLLAAIAIPNFVRARRSSQTNACINNLRQIDAAKSQFALENGKMSTYLPVASEIQTYLGRGDNGSISNICCPLTTPTTALGGYTINAINTTPQCQNYDVNQHPAVMN